MSAPIANLKATAATSTASAAGPADPRRTAKVAKAAHEFESILVKQLLSAAKVGGANPSGYADMAVDALATGVEKAGGLGLARRIEEALSHSLSRAHGPAEPPASAAQGPVRAGQTEGR